MEVRPEKEITAKSVEERRRETESEGNQIIAEQMQAMEEKFRSIERRRQEEMNLAERLKATVEFEANMREKARVAEEEKQNRLRDQELKTAAANALPVISSRTVREVEMEVHLAGLRSLADNNPTALLAQEQERIRIENEEREKAQALEQERLLQQTSGALILRGENTATPIEGGVGDIPSWAACCKCSNFDDTKFMKMCCVSLCPYPGWCIVQKKLMEKLNIPVLPTEQPILYNSFGFAGSGLLFCCFGLAWNREKIIERTGKSHNCLMDTFAFWCCLGWCLSLRDVMYVYPIQPKPNQKFEEPWHACFNLKQVKDKWKCMGCCSVLLCPVPMSCLIQAYTVYQLNKLKIRVLQQREMNNEEKKAAILIPFLKSCCCCCFGFALNRTEIANIISVDDHLALDCLKYSIGCCVCLVLQEYYTFYSKKARIRRFLRGGK